MNLGFVDANFKAIHPDALGARGETIVETVIVLSTTRDGGPAGGAAGTHLYPGVVLGVETATGSYSDYDYNGGDGTQLEEECVILAEEIVDITLGNVRAHVYRPSGSFNWDKLRWATSDDKSNFERAKTNFDFYNVYP